VNTREYVRFRVAQRLAASWPRMKRHGPCDEAPLGSRTTCSVCGEQISCPICAPVDELSPHMKHLYGRSSSWKTVHDRIVDLSPPCDWRLKSS